jgi:hypothetical protein
LPPSITFTCYDGRLKNNPFYTQEIPALVRLREAVRDDFWFCLHEGEPVDRFCQKRDLISRRIADAIREADRVQHDHKLPLKERALALQRIKEVQRNAERELNSHVKQHGCKFEDPRKNAVGSGQRLR